MGPLAQGQDFCIIFPEMGLGGCQVNILVQWDKLLGDCGAKGVAMADLGLLEWVWLRIQLGGSHPPPSPPTLGDWQERPGHGILSLDVGRQIFCLLAKLTFPFGSSFHLSLSSFFLTLPHPWLGAGEPSGHWLSVSWGTWGPVPPLLADLILEGQHQLLSLCSPELSSSGCSLVRFQAALHTCHGLPKAACRTLVTGCMARASLCGCCPCAEACSGATGAARSPQQGTALPPPPATPCISERARI